MTDLQLTNASARLLNFALAQPENMTKTSDILRAGMVTKVLEESIPEAPTFVQTAQTTQDEADAHNANVKAWNRAPFILYDVSEKTKELARSVITKMAEKGRLGASHDVVDLLTALGFKIDE